MNKAQLKHGAAKFKQDIAWLFSFLRLPALPKLRLKKPSSNTIYFLTMFGLLLTSTFLTIEQFDQQEEQRLSKLSQQILTLSSNLVLLEAFYQTLDDLHSIRLQRMQQQPINYGEIQDWYILAGIHPASGDLHWHQNGGYFYSVYGAGDTRVYLLSNATNYYTQVSQRLGFIGISIMVLAFVSYWLINSYKRNISTSVNYLKNTMKNMRHEEHLHELTKSEYEDSLKPLIEQINCMLRRYKNELSATNIGSLKTQYKMVSALLQREIKLQKNLNDGHFHLQQLLAFVDDDKKPLLQDLRQKDKNNLHISQRWQQFFHLEQSYLNQDYKAFDLHQLQQQLFNIYHDHFATKGIDIINNNKLRLSHYVSANAFQVRFILRQILQHMLQHISAANKFTWYSTAQKDLYTFKVMGQYINLPEDEDLFDFYQFNNDGSFKHHGLGIARRLARYYHGDLRLIQQMDNWSGFELSLYLPHIVDIPSQKTAHCWQLAPTQSYQAIILTDEPVSVLSLQQRLYYLGFSKVLIHPHHRPLLSGQQLDIIFSDSLTDLDLSETYQLCPRILIKSWQINDKFKSNLLPPFKLHELQRCLENYLDADFIPCNSPRLQQLYGLMGNTALPHFNALTYQDFRAASLQEDKDTLTQLINNIDGPAWRTAMQADLITEDYIALMDKVRYLYLD